MVFFSVWFKWRAWWSSEIFPGCVYWALWVRVQNWWSNLWGWGAKAALPGKAASWISFGVASHLKNLVAPFTCIHALTASVCIGANEDIPVRSGNEETSSGIESESQGRRKNALITTRLVLLSKEQDQPDHPCSSADRSRISMKQAFDESDACLWIFPVWFLICSWLYFVSLLYTSLFTCQKPTFWSAAPVSDNNISVCRHLSYCLFRGAFQFLHVGSGVLRQPVALLRKFGSIRR